MRHPLWIPLAVATALLAQGCASAQSQPQRLPISPIGARESQTRFFEDLSSPAVMKAVIDMLQDGGFTIDRADATLGFVVGTRSVTKRASDGETALKWTTIAFTYGLAALLPWTKSETVQIEASANVTAVGEGSRVRMTLHRRVLDKDGRLKRAEALTDNILYRDLFEQLDRAVFVADAR